MIHSKVQADGYASVGAVPLTTLLVWLAPHVGIPPMTPEVAAAAAGVLVGAIGWLSAFLKQETVYRPFAGAQSQPDQARDYRRSL